MPFQVLLVDDHKIMRDGIKAILRHSEEFNVIGEAESGTEAVQLCKKKRPDIILMDIGLPGLNGIETTTEILRHNPEAKLVYSKAKPGDLIGLPEGAYHIVSTYLDAAGLGKTAGAGAPTNSIVAADIKVPSGKVMDVTLRHRYATLTLKLVNAAGAEALANTNFTILTPGGDLIKELIGAFPSLTLAEGEYVVIARHD